MRAWEGIERSMEKWWDAEGDTQYHTKLVRKEWIRERGGEISAFFDTLYRTDRQSTVIFLAVQMKDF